MDIFTKFNRKAIDERQIDTLIGLSKGLLADGKVDQSEAEVLQVWLAQCRQASRNPIIVNLLERVNQMLADGTLDQDESAELVTMLRRIAGEQSELGEVAKASTLPLNDPMPNMSFVGRQFLFTGTCAFGTRRRCQEAIESLGGINATGVTRSLDFLILGTYVTDSWAHETFGRKIEKAVEYRSNGVPLAIVTEEHWARSAGLM